MLAYAVDTGIACKTKGTSYKTDQWDGVLTIIFYLFTFLILLYQAKHEWNFMNNKFNRNNAPTTRVLIINLLIAVSFIVRALANLW